MRQRVRLRFIGSQVRTSIEIMSSLVLCTCGPIVWRVVTPRLMCVESMFVWSCGGTSAFQAADRLIESDRGYFVTCGRAFLCLDILAWSPRGN